MNPSKYTTGKKIITISRPWIVVIASFFLTTTFGVLYSYGDFFLPLQSQFSWSNALDSTVPALALLVFSLGAIVGGYFAEKIGFRATCLVGTMLVGAGTILASQIQNYLELLLLFGLIMPLGASFVVIIATASPVLWFLKKRGLAVGIMAAGSGFGTLIVPPIVERLISFYGWRSGFLVLGASFLLLLAVASSFMQTPDDLRMNPYGWHDEMLEGKQGSASRDFTPKQALATRSFWMIYFMFFAGSFGATMFVVHAIPFASTIGINGQDGSVAIGMFGAGSLIARVLIGLVADRFSRLSGIIIAFSIQVISMAFLLLVSSSEFLVLFYLCSFGIGFGYGGYLSDFITLSGDIFGRKWIHSIWALDETAFGIAGVLAPIAAGVFFDTLHSYIQILALATFLAASGLILAIVFANRSKL